MITSHQYLTFLVWPPDSDLSSVGLLLSIFFFKRKISENISIFHFNSAEESQKMKWFFPTYRDIKLRDGEKPIIVRSLTMMTMTSIYCPVHWLTAGFSILTQTHSLTLSKSLMHFGNGKHCAADLKISGRSVKWSVQNWIFLHFPLWSFIKWSFIMRFNPQKFII